MTAVIVKGIGFGLILSVAVGPVFFALIKTSLQKGFKAGLAVALGVSLSDITYIVLSYLGVSQFFDNEVFKEKMALVGGLIIIGFGIATLFNKPKHDIKMEEELSKSTYIRQFFKGILINSFNPSVLLFWIGVTSIASVDYQFDSSRILLFFISILATVLITDIIKIYLANRLRNIITPKVMKGMYILVGIALIGFGVRLMI